MLFDTVGLLRLCSSPAFFQYIFIELSFAAIRMVDEALILYPSEKEEAPKRVP